jgi:hypothetical protein
MMFNAFLFAFFWVSLSKSEHRSHQLVYGEKMVVRTEKDKIMLKVQCYDIDSRHPVVETHVQIYAFTKDYKMVPLRILSPDDELGGRLVTSIPVQISHHVDHHSALSPRKSPFMVDPSGLILRGADSATASRDEIICPVCGESYGTYERLRTHVRYHRIIEERDNFPVENTHLGLDVPEVKPLTLFEVQRHMRASISEIVVIVEGIDPQLSGTFQALQSYKFEDIVWEGDFEKCLSVKDDQFVVDMHKFQMVRVSQTLIDEQNGDVERPSLSNENGELRKDGVVVTKIANGGPSL